MHLGGLTVREFAEIFTGSDDFIERLVARHVKKDDLLRDLIRRLDEAESGTSAVTPAVKPQADRLQALAE